MTFRLSAAVRNATLDAIETAIGTSAILRFRSGDPPAGIASADSGTVLATLNLPSDWMAAASGGTKAKSGTWEDTSADAGGIIGHYRIYASNGTTQHAQGLVSMPHAVSTAVATGVQMNNAGNVYKATTGGTTGASSPPTGTGTGITDGSVTWDYVGPVSMVIDNVNVAATQAVTVQSYTFTAGNA